MGDFTKDASYIKGLCDGLKLDESKDGNKVILALVNIIEKMADKIEAMDEDLDVVFDDLDEMEEAIGDLYDECDCCCDEDCYQIKCDKCGKDVFFTEDDIDDLAEGRFVCPECGEEINVDFGDECGCGCCENEE